LVAETQGDGALPRRYIRHPSEIPIEVAAAAGNFQSRHLRNISVGGLCTRVENCLPDGTRVAIRIPLLTPPFRAEGHVVWCRTLAPGNALMGICFSDPDTAYAIRMVEQVCHIESYRQRLSRERGYDCDSEEAAREWIARYAPDFPPVDPAD
jgi:hypothetical protein